MYLVTIQLNEFHVCSILYSDIGGVIMKSRVLVLHHMVTLSEESLDREIFEIQKIFEFPDLIQKSQQGCLRWVTTPPLIDKQQEKVDSKHF